MGSECEQLGPPINVFKKSIGNGNIIVEFFSADIEFKDWRYRSCNRKYLWLKIICIVREYIISLVIKINKESLLY